MSFLTRNLKQDITVWNQAADKDNFGNLTYSSPRTIKGRWEENDNLTITLDGREITSQAVVFLKEDVAVGDYLFLGTDSSLFPDSVSDAFEVKSFKKTPSLRNSKQFERMAVL